MKRRSRALSRDLGPEQNPDERYDLYVTVKWKTTPTARTADGAIDAEAWNSYPLDVVHGGLPIHGNYTWLGGIMYLGLPWDEACRYARALREARGAGVLVPVIFRAARVSPDEGFAIAQHEFARIRQPDAIYGEVGPPANAFCWWRYSFPNLTAQAADIIPGSIFIHVQKMTGAVAASDETAEWIREHIVE
jgi:hypothetical protein